MIRRIRATIVSLGRTARTLADIQRVAMALSVVTVLAGGTPLAAQAQKLFGVRGGASLANYSGNDGTGAKSRVGFAAGAFLEVPFSRAEEPGVSQGGTAYAVQLEGLFVQKGVVYRHDEQETATLELNHLDFGVLLKASKSWFHAFAGPILSINVTCRDHWIVTYEGESSESSEECDPDETVTFGVKGGVGVARWVGESVRLSLDGSYALTSGELGKSRAFSIEAGAGFPIG